MNQVAMGLGVLYLLWGSTYLGIRYAIESLPPLGMSGARFLLAGLLLFCWRTRGRDFPTLRQWRGAALVGFLLIGSGTGLIAWAEETISSGQAALIVASVPIWMALWQWIRPGGAFPGWRTLSGLALSSAGVALLVGGPGELTAGSLLVIASSLSWTAGSLLAPVVPQPKDGILFSAMTMVAGGFALLAESLLRGETWDGRLTWTSGAAWLYLVVFGSMVGLSLYTWLLRNASPVAVSTYTYVNPLVAVWLAWMTGEALPARLPSAALLILTGLVLVQVKTRLHSQAFEWRLPLAGRPLAPYRRSKAA